MAASRGTLLAGLILVLVPGAAWPQQPAALTREQMEVFLAKAAIVRPHGT